MNYPKLLDTLALTGLTLLGIVGLALAMYLAVGFGGC